MAASSESEVIAQQVSTLNARVATLERRLSDLDKVTSRLEGAALTSARALEEMSRHWDAVYEAMRRDDDPGVKELRRERDSARPRKSDT
jgi:outer membrane murein-binding lipoprotein Lpp